MGRTREEDETLGAKARPLREVVGGAPLVLALALPLAGCPGEIAVTPATPSQAPPAAVVAPRAQVAGYVLADPHALPSNVAVPLENGSFGVVLEGARFVTGAGGDARKASVVAEPRVTRVERVPARLGGGFLFMGSLALYRSETFDGALTPLVALPEQAAQVSFGPNGALVRGVSGQRWAFALPAWARVPMAPVGLVDIAAHGDGRALALTELGRALASTNAGEKWDDVTAKLAGAPARVAALGEDLWLFDDGGRPYRLERGGSFREVERAPAEPARQAKDPRWRGAASPLKTAVLLGAPALAPGIEAGSGLAAAGAAADEATAIVAAGGDIARVDLHTGALLSVAPGRLPPSMTCAALRTPDDVVFVCADGRASLVASGGLRGEPVIEQTFEADGVFYASDDGGLVFGGPCPPEKEGPRKACGRDLEGGWTEHSLDAAIERAGPKGPPPAAQLIRWVARGSAPPLAIVASESLATVDLATGRAVSWSGASIDELFPGSRPQAGKPPPSLPRDARPRLDRRWSATAAGSLDGWLAPGRAVSVSAAGDVRLSPFALDAGSMSGARALGATRDGRVFQTLNHGLTWAEVERPPSAPAGSPSIRGCSDVGCDLGSWLRIGWSEAPPAPAPSPEVASAPPMLPRPALPEMICSPLGEVRTAAAPLRETGEPGLGATLIPSASGAPRDVRTFSYAHETFSYRLIHPAREDTSGSSDTAPRLTVHGFAIARVDDGAAGLPFEVLGPSRAPGSFQRAFTFVAPLDPAGPIRSATLGLNALTPLFRASNAAPIEFLESFAQTSFELLPVLPAEPGGATDLAFTMPVGDGQIIGLLSTGTAPRVKLLVLRAKSGSPVSAAALPGGDLALLSIESDGRERLLRVGKGGVVELAEIPGVEQHHHFAANPDALAIGPSGSLAVLRTPSGDEPASVGDPALLLKLPPAPGNTSSVSSNSIVMEPLAPWSTLTAASQPACSGEQTGYRALLHTQAPWVRVRGSRAFDAAVTAMTAVVQWGPSRACLEAIELPDTPLELGAGQTVEMTIAARFGRTTDAGRFGVRLGSETRQPLSCALTSGPPAQPADPLNMR